MSTTSGVAPAVIAALLASPEPRWGALRPEVVTHTRAAYDALYRSPQALTAGELHALAAVAAAWQGSAPLLAWHLAEGAEPSLLGPEPPQDPRLAALRRHVDLLSVSPATVHAGDQDALADAGASPDEVVLVSQLVAFESFLLRMVAGLGVLDAGAGDTRPHPAPDLAPAPGRTPPGRGRTKHAPGTTVTGRPRPQAYTQEVLDWEPWVAAPAVEELTAQQRQSFAGKASVDSVYFRLIARTPALTAARSALDIAAFQGRGGLPKAERELAAAVASKVNDCVFCASVHARKATGFSKRGADVDRLLAVDLPRDADWVPTDLAPLSAGLDERWASVVDAAAHVSQVRPTLAPAHVEQMRRAGLDELEIGDLITSAAFFAWANRLMLTLGEPALPGPQAG